MLGRRGPAHTAAGHQVMVELLRQPTCEAHPDSPCLLLSRTRLVLLSPPVDITSAAGKNPAIWPRAGPILAARPSRPLSAGITGQDRMDSGQEQPHVAALTPGLAAGRSPPPGPLPRDGAVLEHRHGPVPS